MLDLREYQQQALDITFEKLSQGINKQVHVLATGLGKTVIFSHIIDQNNTRTGKKSLVLAHREELLEQAKDKILKINPNLSVAIEMAEQKAEPDADVIVASVATLGRNNSKRLLKFNPKDFSTIVVDEAHHSSADSYKNVLRHFGVLKGEQESDFDWNKDCLLLGVTATPNRMDNKGIDQIFDEVVFNFGIIDGIKDGWLSRIRAYRVDTTTDLSSVHTKMGDFAQNELADTINNPDRNNLVVKTYLEQYNGKQALVFAVDRAHAIALTEAFNKHGIKTGCILGDTDKDLRSKDLELFHQKEIKVMVNCMVLTEGYDNDTIDVIMMARPTQSGILYQQMIGRGTRTHHEKPYLTICDFVDNTYKHRLKTASSLLGLEGKINFRGQDIVDAIPEIDKIRELSPDFNLDRLDFEKLDYVMEEVDLMSGLQIPSDLATLTTNAWHRYGENAYRIAIGDNRYLTAYQALTGQWNAKFEYWDGVLRKKIGQELGEEKDLEGIITRIDKFIENNYPDSLRLVNMNARWRNDPITPAQSDALRKLGVDMEIILQLNKGTASQLQTKMYAMRGGRM